MGRVLIQGVPIPVPEGPLSDFITPEWRAVVEFYPEFCRTVLARTDVREEPWDPQPYLLEFAKCLERANARPGRTADEWMQRILEHFGTAWFMAVVRDMMAAKADAVGGTST